jgi:hypothetical protein
MSERSEQAGERSEHAIQESIRHSPVEPHRAAERSEVDR